MKSDLSRSIVRPLALLVCLPFVSAGCGGDGGSPTSPPNTDPNQEPSTSIESPGSESSILEGDTVHLEGSATDPEDGELSGSSLMWESSEDGQLGTGEEIETASLSVAEHSVRLIATDSEGLKDTAEVSIIIDKAVAGNMESSQSLDDPSTLTVRHGASEATVEEDGTFKMGAPNNDGVLMALDPDSVPRLLSLAFSEDTTVELSPESTAETVGLLVTDLIFIKERAEARSILKDLPEYTTFKDRLLTELDERADALSDPSSEMVQALKNLDQAVTERLASQNSGSALRTSRTTSETVSQMAESTNQNTSISVEPARIIPEMYFGLTTTETSDDSFTLTLANWGNPGVAFLLYEGTAEIPQTEKVVWSGKVEGLGTYGWFLKGPQGCPPIDLSEVREVGRDECVWKERPELDPSQTYTLWVAGGPGSTGLFNFFSEEDPVQTTPPPFVGKLNAFDVPFAEVNAELEATSLNFQVTGVFAGLDLGGASVGGTIANKLGLQGLPAEGFRVVADEATKSVTEHLASRARNSGTPMNQLTFDWDQLTESERNDLAQQVHSRAYDRTVTNTEREIRDNPPSPDWGVEPLATAVGNLVGGLSKGVADGLFGIHMHTGAEAARTKSWERFTINSDIRDGQVVYKEDFSSDPGFTVPYDPNSGEFFQWDSENGWYEVRFTDANGHPPKFGVTPEFADVDGSFHARMDIQLVDGAWGQNPGAQFVKDVPSGETNQSMQWDHPGADDKFTVADSAGNGVQEFSPRRDIWYRFTVTYDESANSADIEIVERATGDVFLSRQDVTFHPGLFRRIALGDDPDNNEGGPVEMWFDNIVIEKR